MDGVSTNEATVVTEVGEQTTLPMETTMEVEESTTLTGTKSDTEDVSNKSDSNDNAEAAKLKKQLETLQRQFEQVTKEASTYKKELRKTKSAEEQRAEEESERQQQIQDELNQLRKQAAIASNSKKINSFVGSEELSDTIAEYLMGAADVEGAIDELSKAWKEKEKKLKMEYGKIQMGGPSEEEKKRNKAIEFGKERGKAKIHHNNVDNGLKRFII